MKILANRKIKFLFCSILSCILVFVLISTVLVNLDVRNTVYYIIFCSVCMGAAILLFCYGYFKEQHKIMENAISQITEYISGNKEVTIECNDEGELYSCLPKQCTPCRKKNGKPFYCITFSA